MKQANNRKLSWKAIHLGTLFCMFTVAGIILYLNLCHSNFVFTTNGRGWSTTEVHVESWGWPSKYYLISKYRDGEESAALETRYLFFDIVIWLVIEAIIWVTLERLIYRTSIVVEN